MKINNYVFDLDGTLLNKDKKITTHLKNKILEHKKDGKKVFIATGRAWFYAQEFYDELELDTPIIACNGSVIKNVKTGELLFNDTIDKDIAIEIFDYLKSQKLNFLFYSSESMWLRLEPETSDVFIDKVQEYKTRVNVKHQFNINKFDEIEDESIYGDVNKILLLVQHVSKEKLEQVTDYIRNKYSDKLNILASQNGVMDIMPNSCDKGQALNWLHNFGYLNKDETVAFGDADNDIKMLKYAKIGVAMNDGVEEIRQISDVIVDHQNDGIYNYLDELK